MQQNKIFLWSIILGPVEASSFVPYTTGWQLADKVRNISTPESNIWLYQKLWKKAFLRELPTLYNL